MRVMTKTEVLVTFLVVAIGGAWGNLIYASFDTSVTLKQVLERTYFQWFALATAAASIYIRWDK